jgi:hypothetical protein
MPITIDAPFEIGQRVWKATLWPHTVREVCPDCDGQKYITVIQGNGSQYTLDCRCCQSGYDTPKGYVERTVYKSEPTEFTCRRVDISGMEIRYGDDSPSASCWHPVEVKDLFLTKEEAQMRADELNAERTEWEKRQAIANLSSKRKDLAWSAHYWGSQVKRLREDLERTEERLNACKKKRIDKEGEMIGALKKWFVPEEESREDRLSRLAAELRSMTDEDRKMFFHRVYGNDKHIHTNPTGKVRRAFDIARDEIEGRIKPPPDPKDFEDPAEWQHEMEKYQMMVEAQMEGDR